MFFERPNKGLRTLLVSIRYRNSQQVDYDAAEFEELATSAGLEVASSHQLERSAPHPSFCLGKGKAEEISSEIRASNLDLLLIDQDLSGTQQKNLEKMTGVRVMTRTELILHIFEERARTYEGKLQVELAMLSHAQSHIVRGWTHLDRQRGGVNLRGVGEKQLAIDKFLLQKRIYTTKRRLDRVVRQRAQQRSQRVRSKIPTIALVGYTNTGKSTLFNALTQSTVYADDRLFATLDPTIRALSLESGLKVLLADTVGFIRDLPMDLVAAFRATLEEASNADLLLHVMDVTTPNLDEVKNSVEETLREIGANSIPVIPVFNKIDETKLPPGSNKAAVYISAREGMGLSELKCQINDRLRGIPKKYSVELEPQDGKVRSLLYQMRAVEKEKFSEDGRATLTVNLAPAQAQEFEQRHGVTLQG